MLIVEKVQVPSCFRSVRGARCRAGPVVYSDDNVQVREQLPALDGILV